jgi:AcrR family transcriptional regulator
MKTRRQSTTDIGIKGQRSTRELILDHAERLIALRGVTGFTLKDISEPLGVQVPAIYKHYASRDDVLVEVSRRFITQLSGQFFYLPEALARPTETMRDLVGRFADFHIENPAYVRLSLTDFATPEGGIEYVRLAAGGAFRDNLMDGPLAPMHERLRHLVAAGQRRGEFRRVASLDFYRVIKSSLLIRLVYPDDLLVQNARRVGERRRVKTYLWDVASRYVTAT